MKRNLVVLFDGTWNEQGKGEDTNVCRLRQSIDTSGEDDDLQPCFYDPGVGTAWHERLRGGAFGYGLSENIRQGYDWLSRKYREDDDIFVFGFSRGAYTARSLVGLIRKCGLLRAATPELVAQAYALYRDKSESPKDVRATAFRHSFAREVRVRFIGVWDTVGALGVPVAGVPFNRDYFQWHDTELSGIVDYAYHAIALDEHRKDYEVAVWRSPDGQQKPENVDVEQRWFVGAHANVGGGYAHDHLCQLPLRWMQDKAAARGLQLRSRVTVDADAHRYPLVDSYAEFMSGLYQRMKPRYHRLYGIGVNETVDDSVWLRWQADPAYRPASLLGHPGCPGN